MNIQKRISVITLFISFLLLPSCKFFISGDSAKDETSVSSSSTSTLADPLSIDITSPKDGMGVRDAVKIEVTVGSDVVRVEFYINETKVLSDTKAPFIYDWDTTKESEGGYSLKAKAYDADGRVVIDDDTKVTVWNETVNIKSPADGDVVSAKVPLSAEVTGTVETVTFFVNEAKVCTAASGPSFTCEWQTGNDGDYAVKAVATAPASLNSMTAVDDDTTVTVANSNPAINLKSPSDGSYINSDSTVTFSAQGGDYTIEDVKLVVDSTELNCTQNGNDWNCLYDIDEAGHSDDGAHSLKGVLYYNSGQTIYSNIISVTVDTTPPAVSVLSPSEGAKVSGSSTVSASASGGDIASITVTYNGTTVIHKEKVSSINEVWNTLQFKTLSTASGLLSITAVDHAGNTGAAVERHVRVNNPVLFTSDYNSETSTAKIYQVSLEGGYSMEVYSTNIGSIVDVKVDSINESVYFTDSMRKKIYKMPIDGGGISTIYDRISAGRIPWMIDLDVANSTIHCLEYSGSTYYVYAEPIDGSGSFISPVFSFAANGVYAFDYGEKATGNYVWLEKSTTPSEVVKMWKTAWPNFITLYDYGASHLGGLYYHDVKGAVLFGSSNTAASPDYVIFSGSDDGKTLTYSVTSNVVLPRAFIMVPEDGEKMYWVNNDGGNCSIWTTGGMVLDGSSIFNDVRGLSMYIPNP